MTNTRHLTRLALPLALTIVATTAIRLPVPRTGIGAAATAVPRDIFQALGGAVAAVPVALALRQPPGGVP